MARHCARRVRQLSRLLFFTAQPGGGERVIVFFYELDNTIGAEMRCLMQWSACSFMRCKDALVASCMYIIMLQCYAVVSVMLC